MRSVSCAWRVLVRSVTCVRRVLRAACARARRVLKTPRGLLVSAQSHTVAVGATRTLARACSPERQSELPGPRATRCGGSAALPGGTMASGHTTAPSRAGLWGPARLLATDALREVDPPTTQLRGGEIAGGVLVRGLRRRVRLRGFLRSDVRRIRGDLDGSWLAALFPARRRGRLDVDLGRFGRPLPDNVDVGLSGKSTW